MTLTPLAEVGPWQILHRPGAGALILSCASIGHDPTRAPSPEWVGTTRPHGALFILDASRSWGTAPGLSQALTQALAQLPPVPMLALGVSMGAVVALTLSHLLPLEALIAIGPQHQPAAPSEPRWRAHTAALPADLTAPSPKARHNYILRAEDDQTLPLAANTDTLTYPSQSHSTLALHLKPLMPGLIASALTQDRRRALRLLTGAGGRQEPKWTSQPAP